MLVTLTELRNLLNAANVEYVITRTDGPLVHINFYVEEEKKDATT
jgi:hypothetical protein